MTIPNDPIILPQHAMRNLKRSSYQDKVSMDSIRYWKFGLSNFFALYGRFAVSYHLIELISNKFTKNNIGANSY